MGLHKPTNIPMLKDIMNDPADTLQLNDVKPYSYKVVSKDDLSALAQTELYYPVVEVPDKHLLIADSSKGSKRLVWLSGWFEVDSAFCDSKNIHRVRLKINGKLVETEYSSLYPKDITGLSNYGLLIDSNHADSLSRYVFQKIAGLNVTEKLTGMGFILHDDSQIFRAYDEEPEVLQYTNGISMDDYTSGINALLTNTAIMFAFCCSCATIFLAYLSIVCGLPLMSFLISFYGKTTTGKSTSQTLMTSVFTHPEDRKVYMPLFGTRNALIKAISQKYGVPQLFDEATIASNNDLEHLIYTITNENEKGRCSSDGTLREMGSWKLIVITSSENRLLDDTQMHNRGLDARLLSFELKFTDDREHSDRIHAFCGKNYGILGKALSEYLLSTAPDAVAAMYANCKNTMRDAIDDAATFDLSERLINEYAVILLAATVLADFGFHMDMNGIIAILSANCSDIRERTDIAMKYYNHLVSYTILHPYTDGIKKDESTNTIAIIDELFLSILARFGATNTDLVIKELDAAGYLFRRKQSALKNRLRFNGTLANCYEIVLPPNDEASDEDCPTLEFILTHYEGLDES